jgi:uncharacterized protein (TIGR00369 family)
MGVKLTEATPERVVATMLVRPDLCTAGGILHGGAPHGVRRHARRRGHAAEPCRPGKRTTTTDSSTKFIGGAAVNTTVTAESVALPPGRTTMVWQTTVRNEQGRLCSVVTQTQLVLD